jgi:hypothetical protein
MYFGVNIDYSVHSYKLCIKVQRLSVSIIRLVVFGT